jgi:hypothetical protein
MKVFQIIRNITGTVVFETELQSVLKVEIARCDLDLEIYSILTITKTDRDLAFEKLDELNEDIYELRMKIEILESDLKAAEAERCLLSDEYGFGMH